MKNKTLITLLWTVSLASILFTIYFYYCQFGDGKISNDPEKWGQFADYFGGILNPLLSLLNLIILTYLSIRLVKDEDERNKWTLQELARPYADIEFHKTIDEITIEVHNCGLGPMIIRNITILDEQENEFSNFRALISFINTRDNVKEPNKSIARITSFKVTNNHCAIKKDDQITVLRVTPHENNLETPEYPEFLNRIKEKISEFKIQVEYTDMYNRKMETMSEKIEFLQ